MEANNSRIVKNTLLLYMRMIITMVVNLFTSRVVLNALGFSDYGIYNVVGGVVAMFAFLSVGMSGASQRFITYELGRGDVGSLKNTFCTSILTHAVIALIVIVIMESLGIWFVNSKLVIPFDRLFAANWVFQCSILSFALMVVCVPYNSCIIAHEKMDVYAFIAIYDVVMKLIIAYSIYITKFDKLVLYSSLILFEQGSINLIYYFYCKRKFEECSFKYKLDVPLFKKMFSFAGWGCIGNMGFSTKDQGSNIILNLFFGTTVNAARGIATQVSGMISSFASNFTVAMNPQITKLYASGEEDKCRKMAYAGSRYAFLLLSFIAIPFLTNEHYVLTLWLGAIPDYTDYFVCIILLCALIYSMSNTLSTVILATGKVKWFQIGLATILLSELPIAYVILALGGTPYQAMLPSIFTNFASVLFRVILLHKMNPEFSIKEFFVVIVLRCFSVFIVGLVLSLAVKSLFEESFSSFVITTLISVVIVSTTIMAIGINKEERILLLAKIKSYLGR